MKGSEVFTFGLKFVKKDLQNMSSKYPESLVILHQAGKVMLDGLMKVIGEDALIPCNFKKHGNLVSSSIPFLLYENLEEFNNSKSIIMSGFGVGLSSHTIVLSKD
jgi:3-oxoacyl-[acyl-carrier-protein] synthase III